MNNNLQKLEFNKVLDILSSFCVTDNGKKLALELLPSNSSMEVSLLWILRILFETVAESRDI